MPVGAVRRTVLTTWATTLVANAAFLFCLKHSHASVFCKASEVATRSHGAVRHMDNNRNSGQQQLHVDTSEETELDEEGGDVGAEPEQIHLSIAGSGLEKYAMMTVAWATWPETPQPVVIWGKSVNELDSISEGSTTSYSADHPGRTPYTSGFLHSATMVDLLPSTTYYFSCGDRALGMSSVRSFVTPPQVGGEQAVTFGIIGDLGQTEDSERTLAAIDADKSLNLVLHGGDLSYADCDQPRWDSFMRILDPVASRLPWMVAAGNHEIEAGSTGGKPFVAYEKRFRMPAAAAPKQSMSCGRGGGLEGDEVGDTCWEGLGVDEAQAAATSEAMRLRYASRQQQQQQQPVEVVTEEGPAAVEAGGKDADLAVAAAARRVRKRHDPAVVRKVSRGADVDGGENSRLGENRGENAGGVAEASSESAVGEGGVESGGVSCCPSEWSGTYDYGNSFYSFNVASVHVVVLNPYTATGEKSVQYEWAQKDLEAIDRTLTPWVIAMFHCPWYNSNLAHQGERQQETAMRAMEPLLNKHRVAIVVSGHVHAYERSYPVVDHELSADAPTYLVVGGAGNREGHAAGFYPKPDWSAFRDGTAYGFGRLSIRDSKLALWQWTSTEEGSSIQDFAWISNPYFNPAPGASIVDQDDLDELRGETGRESPHRLGADNSESSRHEIAGVRVASKMQQRQAEEEDVARVASIGQNAVEQQGGVEGVVAEEEEVHERGRVGGRLRVPGLANRRQRVA